MPILKLLILSISILGASCAFSATFLVGINPVSTTTSGLTSYSFNFIVNTITSGNISKDSYFAVTFPNDYPLATLMTGLTGPDSGLGDNCFTVDLTQLTLNSSGRTFRIGGAFPDDFFDDFMMQFSIVGITNPNRVKTTSPFTLSLYTSTGVLLLSDSTQTVTTTPGQLTCSLTPTVTDVQSPSPYTISITPNTMIPSNGQLKMTFPSNWPNDLVKSNTVLSNITTCVGDGTTTSLGLSCVLDDATKVNVTNLFDRNQSTTFSFKMEMIGNPVTTESVGTVVIASYDGNMMQIDQCSGYVTGVTPSKLAQMSFTVSSSSISTSNIGSLKFTTSKVLFSGDKLQVTFPTSFLLTKLNISTMIVGANIFPAPINNITSSNLVTISIPITSSLTSNVIIFTFSNVTTPPSTLLTENFEVSTMRNGSSIEYGSCCGFTATAGILTATILPGSYLAGAITEYTFTITTVNGLLQTGKVQIVFPKEYVLVTGSGNCVGASGTNVSATANCAIQAPRTLTVSNLLTGPLSGGNTITIKAGSIPNPPKALTSSTFKISTIYSSSGGYADTLNSLQVTIQPSSITSVTLSTSNLITYQPANYTLTITNTNSLNTGSFLQITIPTDITVGSIGCFVAGITPVTCNAISMYVVNVTNLMNATVGVGGMAALPLTIVGLTNPTTMKTTGSFSVTIFTSQYATIESMSTGIIVTMDTASPFSSLSLTPTSLLTGSPTTYTLDLSSPYPLPNNTNLTLSFPPQYTISNSPTCTPLLHLSSLDCGSSISPVTMLLPLTTSSTNTVRFSLSTVTNPLSLATPSAITVRLYGGGYLSLEGGVVGNRYAANLVTYTVGQTGEYMGEATNLSLAITTSNVVPPNGYLTTAGYVAVTVPAEYTTSSLGCGAITGVSASSCSITSNVVKITGTSYQTSITVELTGLTNPISTTSSTFSVKTYDNLNNLVDASTSNYQYSLSCTIPCRSCTSTPTQCLSCYTLSTLQSVVSNRQYLTQSTCAISCNSSSYSDANYICYACSTSCLTCSVNPNNCTSCPVSLPYILTNTCYSTCPTGYYSNTTLNTCEICINNCKTCTSTTVCLTCDTNYYLNVSQCISSCPPLTYNLNGVCTNCSSNCVYCDSTGCLVCATSYYLYLGVCYLNCPFGVYIYNSGCASCNTSCLTCTTYANTCASCVTTNTLRYLYSGSCLAACPTGYYPNNFICVGCVSPCLECTGLTTCTKCVVDQVMYKNSCTYTVCPGSTIQIGSECFDCTSPCLTCNVSQTYCLTCINNYYLENSTCVATCSSGLFGINGKCVACAEPCLQCVANKPYNCTSCIADYFLNGDTCYSTCPTGTYTSFSEGKCKTCGTSCQTCTNSTNCTSCVSGLFLFKFGCYSSCPTVPTFYYAYQSLCLTCQPQCTSCLSSPIQCVSCSSTQYLHNIITKTCLFSCQMDYYQNNTQCIPCQSPCKTCDTVFNSCASCESGLYLYQGKCIISCPTGYYNAITNRCVECIYPCVECTQQKCLKCGNSSSYYKGGCYFVCPEEVPEAVNGFCTNCPGLAYCLDCGGGGQCTACISPYYNYQGQCVKSCPENYEPDSTGAVCKMTATYLAYLDGIEQDRRRNLPFPFIILFLCFCVSLIVSKCLNKPTYYIGTIISFGGLFQFCSWILFLVFLIIYGSTVKWLPYLVAALFGVNLLFNFLNLIPIITVFRQDFNYKQWLKQGNETKEKVIIAASILTSFKFSRVMFCRYFDIPAFSSCLLAVDKFQWWNRLTWASFFFVEGLAIAVAMLAAFNQPAFYTKLFFASVEVVFFSALEICVELADLRKDQHRFFKQEEEDPLIDDANMAKGPMWGDEDIPKLGKTKSLPKLNLDKTEYQIADDYISVYDPSDYEDVPKMINSKVPRGIEKGKFRRKNKKKLADLWSIAEISDEGQDPTKKKKKNGGGPTGYLNNYLYWKPPKAEKVKKEPKKQKPLELSEIEQQMIFETIRNKQSEFDRVSKHEDFFGEKRYGDYQQLDRKGSVDVSMSEDLIVLDQDNSHNLIFDPDDLMNTHYAKKQHIEKRKEQPYLSENQTRRPLTKVGGHILKNMRRNTRNK